MYRYLMALMFMVLMLFLFHQELRSLVVIPDAERMQTLCHSLSYLNFDKNDHKDSHSICTKKAIAMLATPGSILCFFNIRL